MKLYLNSGRGAILRRFPVLFVFLLAFAGLCSADNVPVTCDGATYGQINQAIAGLTNKAGPNTIIVTGTCVDTVLVSGFTALNLVAGAGGAAIVPPAPPAGGGVGSALRIEKSDQVSVSGFTIGPASTASGVYDPSVSIYGSTRVTLTDCIIQYNPLNAGLSIQSSQDVNIMRGEIAHNHGGGVTVTGASNVSIGDWGYLGDTTKVTKIDNNGATNSSMPGISAGMGAYLYLAPGVTVTQNAGDGVDVSANSYLSVCCGNGFQNGTQTYAEFISQNGGAGVYVSENSAMFMLNAQVENNVRDGIHFERSSGNIMDSMVAGNGTTGGNPTTGGIVANYNSGVGIFGSTYTPGGAAYSTITNNNGPGVEANGNSSVWFCCNVNINGNSGDGVLLQSNSSGTFLGNSNISGNAQHDLDCTSGGVGVSTKGAPPGIGKNHCSSFTKLP